ncbi:MAG: hypothetical protein ABSB61_06470 [Anaerolineales bacterium]|jgi:hypothetical protein
MSDVEKVLQLAALILSLVNGTAILYQYVRDKPILKVDAIHPDKYQWWFPLPSRVAEESGRRRYGLLTYVGIANQGLRKVQLTSWRLLIKTKAGKRVELMARSIPEPKFAFTLPDSSTFTKVIQVLGTAGEFGSGSTVIDSGCSIIGVAYYVAEFQPADSDDLSIVGDTTTATFVAKGVLGRSTSTPIHFHKTDFDWVKSAVSGIEAVS